MAEVGSFASILRWPLSLPLSTTPDITTSDRDPSACRLPAPDLQTTGSRRRSYVIGSGRSDDTRRHVRPPKTRHVICNEPVAKLLPRRLVPTLSDRNWRRAAQERRGADRRPSDGKI